MAEIELIKKFLDDTSNENSKPMDGDAPPPEKPCPRGARVYRLPEPDTLPDETVDFLEMIELRASVREYTNRALTLDELSFLLWCSQGVKGGTANGGTIRNVPSAGARHALETYILVNRVEGLERGIYRFLALGHALLPVKTGDEMPADFTSAFHKKGMVEQSAATFIWCADFMRMAHRYGNRAARYIFLDAGHACQNLYLAGHVKKIGTCAVGSFDDARLNGFLGFDGANDFAVYAATVGKVE